MKCCYCAKTRTKDPELADRIQDMETAWYGHPVEVDELVCKSCRLSYHWWIFPALHGNAGNTSNGG